MQDFTTLEEVKITSEEIFDGQVVHLFKDTVRLPNGNTGTRETIRHIGAVAIVPMTEEGNVIVERQFRYPLGQVINMYLAKGLHKGTRNLDEDEFLNIREVPLADLVEEIMEGKIADGKTQTALLKAARLLL